MFTSRPTTTATMKETGLLSFPSELLYKIIETCPGPERCHLRATCKVLNEHADPIVFRRLHLYLRGNHTRITEHQIISLVTQSSKACEFTRHMRIFQIPAGLRASGLSLPHLRPSDDLRLLIPTAISNLKNMTSFRWTIFGETPDWLINSLMQAVASLPHLTELDVDTFEDAYQIRIPFGNFSNLSKLSVDCGSDDDGSFFISQLSTVIANSPQLQSLSVTYMGSPYTRPTLSELFAKVSTKNPMHLEHLSISFIDATMDQVVLPHLKHLTSFQMRLQHDDFSVARSVWTNFLTHGVKLSDVDIEGSVTEEMMLYLSSFSGLKRLSVSAVFAPAGMTLVDIKNMLYGRVLPKHINSLQTLLVWGGKGRDDGWVFDHSTLTSMMICRELCDLCVYVDELVMPAQLLLDTVANLPKLTILRIFMLYRTEEDWLADFKPTEGLRYVEELTIEYREYVLEKDGERPVGYRALW